LALWFLFGGARRPVNALQSRPPAVPITRGAPHANPPADHLADFVSSVLGDTEDVWRGQFRMMQQAYKEPRLVLFTRQVLSACGIVSSTVGPAYCPSDERIYIDLGFFQELEDRYHASGDFARAYVVAHEVGHHVQKLLGFLDKARSRQAALSKDQREQLPIRLELQADFLAGVWAHRAQEARHLLEPGDVEAALRLLTAIGDDRLRLESHGDWDGRSSLRCWDRRHGTGVQKVRWFSRGLKTGDLSQGDTIDAAEL
jgi:predicted metalloprotease